MSERNPYPRPATAKEAALALARAVVAERSAPEELIAGRYGVYRPDDNAVVSRV